MHTTISNNYQVVIPKTARKALKLRPRQKLTVFEKSGVLIFIPQRTLKAIRGIAAGTKLMDTREKKDRRL